MCLFPTIADERGSGTVAAVVVTTSVTTHIYIMHIRAQYINILYDGLICESTERNIRTHFVYYIYHLCEHNNNMANG